MNIFFLCFSLQFSSKLQHNIVHLKKNIVLHFDWNNTIYYRHAIVCRYFMSYNNVTTHWNCGYFVWLFYSYFVVVVLFLLLLLCPALVCWFIVPLNRWNLKLCENNFKCFCNLWLCYSGVTNMMRLCEKIKMLFNVYAFFYCCWINFKTLFFKSHSLTKTNRSICIYYNFFPNINGLQ